MSGPIYQPAALTRTDGGPQPLKLNVGCGRNTMPDFLNCDLDPAPHVDRAFDLQKEWPFEDDSAGVVYASHVLEHLTDPFTFMRQAHRVLMPGGQMTIRVPYGNHRSAWWDLTHVRPWFAESFCMFQHGHAACTGNPQHLGWQWPFAIHCADLRIAGNFRGQLQRGWKFWRPSRKDVLNLGRSLTEFCEEMWVYLSPLKSAEAIEAYQVQRPHFGNAVYIRWVMYRHQWEGRERPDPGEVLELLHIGEDDVRAAWAMKLD